MKKLRSKDLLLLLLYVPGPTGELREPIRGRTLFQKMVFLFEKEVYPRFRGSMPISEEQLPLFEPHRFGPFSKTIMEDLEFLVNLGLIEVTARDEPSEPEETEYEMWREAIESGDEAEICIDETYRISDHGAGFLRARVLPLLAQCQVDAVSMLKINCLKLGLDRVLHYVYTKYPESATRSEIRHRVLHRGV